MKKLKLTIEALRELNPSESMAVVGAVTTGTVETPTLDLCPTTPAAINVNYSIACPNKQKVPPETF